MRMRRFDKFPEFVKALKGKSRRAINSLFRQRTLTNWKNLSKCYALLIPLPIPLTLHFLGTIVYRQYGVTGVLALENSFIWPSNWRQIKYPNKYPIKFLII